MEKLKENQFIPVGKKFKVGFRKFKAVETKSTLSCEGCCFNDTDLCNFMRNYFFGDCSAFNRPDGKEVYFVECKE